MNPTPFARVKMSGSGQFHPPPATLLTWQSQPGQCVKWWNGEHENTGVLRQWEEHIAVVECADEKLLRIPVVGK